MPGKGEAEERRNRAAHGVLEENHLRLIHYFLLSLMVTEDLGSKTKYQTFLRVKAKQMMKNLKGQ